MFLLRALYKNGYDEMKITFKDILCEHIRTKEKKNVMNVISMEVARLNGVEIFSQKEDYCIIKSISEDTIKAFDTMLRRIFLLASETISDLIDGYEKGNIPLLQTIQNLNKVYHFASNALIPSLFHLKECAHHSFFLMSLYLFFERALMRAIEVG